jgi:DNA-binding protein HU-beta
MTQKQLTKAVAEQLDFHPGDVEAVFDATAEILAKNLKKKDIKSIPVRGLGRFALKATPKRAARMGRNPATGEEIRIGPKPAGKKVRVTPDKGLRDALGAK